jgi:hypothetical protein
MGAATEFRPPHRPDALAYLFPVEDNYLSLDRGLALTWSPLNSHLRANLAPATRVYPVDPANHPGEAQRCFNYP